MAAKSASNRRNTASKNSVSSAAAHHEESDEALEDALAYEHGFTDDDDEEDEASYFARAQTSVRELTRQREGRVVVAALATGFAIGAAIGCVIAGSRERKQTWSDRLACEGLGRRLLDRIGSAVPESISERFSR
jgi:lipid-binding SYLF domain-containing protein